MPTVDVIDQTNKKVGTLDLNDSVFSTKVNVALVHQVIKAQLAGRRRGTAKTKTVTEVRGGGKKPYKQKGTGNARTGSTRSSIHVGGGQNFGPTPRSYEQATPKKMMAGALRSALSDRLKSERLLVLNEFKLKDAKTRELNEILKDNLKVENVLVVDHENDSVERSGRNLARVKVLRAEGLNVYDIVKHDYLICTKGAVEQIEARLAVQKGAAQ